MTPAVLAAAYHLPATEVARWAPGVATTLARVVERRGWLTQPDQEDPKT